jgi:hypothetical protein
VKKTLNSCYRYSRRAVHGSLRPIADLFEASKVKNRKQTYKNTNKHKQTQKKHLKL